MNKSKNRTSLKLFGLLFLLASTLLYALFQGGFVSWFLFYSFLPFALYSLLLIIYPIKSFKVIREVNQVNFKAGEKLVGNITLTRNIPIPIAYIVIEELLPKKLQHCHQAKPAKVILFPWFKRKISYQYEISSMPRGEHTFTAIRVKFGDLLGLIEKEHLFSIKEKFLVFPKIVPIEYRQLNNQYHQGMTSSNVKVHRDTTIAVGVREYTPGDRFTWIDWKSTARRNTFMTKEFEQQQSHDVLIVLNRMKSDWFEEMVTFTASLTKAILRKGAKAGLISIGVERSIFPLLNNDEHNQKIYYHLAKVEDNSIYPFASVINSEKKNYPNTVTYMFITSTLDTELVQTVERLSFQNVHIMLFVIKEKVTQLTGKEKAAIDVLRSQGIFAKVVGKEQFSDVFIGVDRT